MNARANESDVATVETNVVSIAPPRWARIRHLHTGNVVAEHLVDCRADASKLLDCYQELWPTHPLYIELAASPVDDAPDLALAHVGQGGVR